MNDIIFKTILLKGEAGNNIQSIEKTATSGLVDTYTITLTDGTTTTFEVTNGKTIESIEKTATEGLVDTYTITFNDNTTIDFSITNGSSIESVEKTATSGLVDTYTITLTNGDTTTFEVTNGKDTTQELAEEVSRAKTSENALSARIDAFTHLSEGSTTGDAELIDARVGIDGTPYANVGGAIRGQVTDLKSTINELNDTYFAGYERLNLFNKDSQSIVNGYFIQDSGAKSANANWSYDIVGVVGGKTIYIYSSIDDNSVVRTIICFYDASGDVITGGNDGYNRAIVVPATAVKMSVSFVTVNKDYLNIGYSSERLYMGHEYNDVLKTDNVLDRYVIEVGADKRITSVINAFKHASALPYKVTINIYDGEYDLLSELGGTSFLSSADPTKIWSELNPTFVGDVIINGIGNVTLKMEIDDATYAQYSSVASKLSIINNKGNIEVNNINMVGKNIRYSIHDECDNVNTYDGTKHIYKNCHIENESCLACVGIGYSSSEYVFENCFIKMSSNNNVFYSHTWSINSGGTLNLINTVIDSTRTTGLILQVLSNAIFDVNLLSSYLKKVTISSGDASTYTTNIFRIVGINCNSTSVDIADSIASSIYEPIFYN